MDGGMRGVIVKGIGGFYSIRTDDGRVFILRARGVFRKRKQTPLIGDWVVFSPGEGEDEGWIDRIEPRKNELIRPPVANVSYLIIVIAPVPKPDLLLVDMLLADARRKNIEPVLVVNKSDLDFVFCGAIAGEYEATGDKVFIVSARKKTGLSALDSLMRAGICCFAGQSGVGKSSLVTAITGIALTAGAISERIERGRHTTRHAELIMQNGYQVLDTAGFSLLEKPEPEDPVMLKSYYPEFSEFESQCRFQPCYHYSEPGCAVLKAAQEGRIAEGRVERYHQLLDKAKEAWKVRYE